MDHSNSELFTNGYDTFLLDSSSPPLVADPGPTDAPPLSGDVFDPSSLDGSGFDGLGSQQRPPELLLMEDIGPTQVEEMDLGMPEQMGSGVQKVTAPDTFIADDSLHNSSAYGLEDFMGGPCTEEHNAGPGFQEPPSGNMFDDVGTEAGTGFHFNPNQLEEPSILARIGALEAKVDEFLKWKAGHTKRSIELSNMMDDIIKLLHEYEIKLDRVSASQLPRGN